MALIQWFDVYPFTEPRRCVGLAFAYDPEVVELLKRANRELRDLVQSPTMRRQGCGWLSDRHIWFVDYAIWTFVQTRLRGRGHVIAEDSTRHELPHGQSRQTPEVQALDPYAVLGITAGATWEEIRSAYLRSIKALHPDVNPAAVDPEVNELLTRRSAALNRAFHELEERVGRYR